MRALVRPLPRTGAVVTALVALAVAPGAAAPVGPPVDAGDVVVVDERGGPMSGGGSGDQFSLQLPDEAACPGDSLHEQWRVQSFMVPDGVDVASLEYGPAGPTGHGRYALFAFDTRSYADILTQPNAVAGQPGRIAIPMLTFTVFPRDLLEPGTYRIGVACTYFRDADRYWDTTIVVAADAGDEPSGFTWTVLDAPAGSSSEGDDGSSPGLVAGVGAGAFALAAGAAVWSISRRRRAPSPPLAKERS